MSLEDYMPRSPSRIMFEEVRDGIDVYLGRNDFKRARMYLRDVEEFLTVNDYVVLDDLISEYETFDKQRNIMPKKKDFYGGEQMAFSNSLNYLFDGQDGGEA